ncbi:hypothetical protein B296_00033217 [Ensete ventricosum]|uniref:Uncharacterized protein n=1 Tax=Ensete ventricosum TaxID=4639 RepID=A0A426X7M9_ENSVE|nr:hypothetical protein B296_00033217 [Ensete ventricosum]
MCIARYGRYVSVRLLLGGTIDWGCFRSVTIGNRSVMVNFNRRQSILGDINRGPRKKEEEEEEKPGVALLFPRHLQLLEPPWKPKSPPWWSRPPYSGLRNFRVGTTVTDFTTSKVLKWNYVEELDETIINPLSLNSFQSAFFTAALLSSIAAASHSSPLAATSVAAPPSRRAPVPQRSLARVHNSVASTSCYCSALMPLPIAVVAPSATCSPTSPAIPTISHCSHCNPLSQPPSHSRLPCRLQPSTAAPPAHNHRSPAPTIAATTKVLANRSRYPSSTVAGSSRCYLLPSSIAAASSSLPLPSARPQQHTASIDTAASLTAFPAFCPLFHVALSLCRIIILPKGGLSPATSVSPLLICRRLAFGSALPLPPLPPVGRRYPLPAYYRSRLYHLSSSPFFPVAVSLLSLHPLRPLLSAVPSPASPPPPLLIVGSSVAQPLPRSRNHRRPQRCPSPISSYASSVAIAVSRHRCHLSLVVAATHHCLLPCRCCPRCHSCFQPHPCHCTSLLPPLQLLVTGCCLMLPLHPLNCHLHLIHSLNNNHPTSFTDN